MASGSTAMLMDSSRDRGSTALRIHARPARSIFSNALNFCCSAIAAFVRSPWRYCSAIGQNLKEQ
jgi:hypothetical protein